MTNAQIEKLVKAYAKAYDESRKYENALEAVSDKMRDCGCDIEGNYLVDTTLVRVDCDGDVYTEDVVVL